MTRPWLKLHRAIKDHPVMECPYRAQGWLWLLTSIADVQTTAMVHGRTITLLPGSMAISHADMADELGWTRARVRSVLEWFAAEGMVQLAPITSGKRVVGTIVEVVNWASYQGRDVEVAPKTAPKTAPNDLATVTSRSHEVAPKTAPKTAPIIDGTRARTASPPQEEKREMEEVEGAGVAPASAIDQGKLRVSESLEPKVELHGRGAIRVSFRRPPSGVVTSALREHGFTFLRADRCWEAEDSPGRRALLLAITGVSVEAAKPAAVAVQPVTCVQSDAVDVGLDDEVGLRLRATALQAAPESDALLRSVAIRCEGRQALVVYAPTEFDALLLEKRYGRLLSRLVGSWSVRIVAAGQEAACRS